MSVPLLILNDEALLGVAQRPDVGRALPALKSALDNASKNFRPDPGCSSCQRQANLKEQRLLAVKRVLAEMGAREKAKLKALLGVERLQFTYRTGQGQNVRLQF